VAPVPDFRCSAFCRFGRRDIVSLIEDVWIEGRKETKRLFHEVRTRLRLSIGHRFRLRLVAQWGSLRQVFWRVRHDLTREGGWIDVGPAYDDANAQPGELVTQGPAQCRGGGSCRGLDRKFHGREQ